MSRLPAISALREDDAWRVTVVGGFVALVLVVSTSTVAGGFGGPVGFSISLSPVFLGGAIAGYLADGNVELVGKRVALIAAAPMAIWLVVHGVAFMALGDAGPTWFRVAGVGFVAFAAAMALVVAILAGMLGALVGGWLS